MGYTPPTNSRIGLRVACALVALLVFGYLAEIYFCGAPSWKKHSDRVYDRVKDPVEFWSQFSFFTILGIIFGYVTICWDRTLQIADAFNARDKKKLESMTEKQAHHNQTGREMAAWIWMSIGGIIVAMAIVALCFL